MKILVVDDVQFTCTFLQRVLEKANHQVLIAYSGNEAIKQLKANPDTSLVITDMYLPDFSGTEIFTQTQRLEVFNGIDAIAMPPFILMSASHDKELEKTALEMGFKRFLKKPIEPEALIALIGSLKAISHSGKALSLVIADTRGSTYDWMLNMLEGSEHRIIHVKTGKEVCRLIEDKAAISIIIAEDDLDDMSGTTLYKRAKALQYKQSSDEKAANLIPFLLIAEQLTQELLKEMKDANIKDVMPKPLDMALMAEKLSKLSNTNQQKTPKKEADAVLVIDDVGFNQVIVERILKNDGLEVLKASSAYDAIELFKLKTNIRAVVCDLMMPGMDGIELYRYMQNSDYTVPEFILVTASNDQKRLEDARRLGFFDVLQKPLKPERIREIIHKVLSGGKAETTLPAEASIH